MKRSGARRLGLTPVPTFPARGTAGFWSSFAHAWRGLVHTVAHQRNMRVHLVSAILVGEVGSGIPLGLAEKVTMIFCVLMVFFAEILNSALEHLVDLAVQQFDPKARVAKDAAAAGVFVLATGTVVIFAAILVHNWDTVRSHGPQVARQFMVGIPIALCGALLVWRRRKAIAVDVLLLVTGCGLLLAQVPTSESYVFSAMTFGLLVLAAAAALEQHQGRPRA